MADRLDPELLSRLVSRRRTLRIAQRELARRMGTTQSAVSDLEAARSVPRIATLQRWAAALGMKLSITLNLATWLATATDVERCPRCGERLYSPAETETHNRTVHNFGPVGTVWAEAEPETRRAD